MAESGFPALGLTNHPAWATGQAAVARVVGQVAEPSSPFHSRHLPTQLPQYLSEE
jgi:hypothetical protein